MPVIRWTAFVLLALGYGLALAYGQLQASAILGFALLAVAAVCTRTAQPKHVRWLGHGLFVVLAIALAAHWLPGFANARVIAATRFSADAVPFTMYLNLDKPLIGFWLLLGCPWVATGVCTGRTLRIALTTLILTTVACMALAMSLGVVIWSPKWPDTTALWLANNLLLVSLTEELLFRGYIQGGLQRLLKGIAHGDTLALGCAAALFGLAHIGGGWQWMFLATLAGVGYGMAYRRGGLPAALLTHFGLNLVHFGLFSYPMLE
ncbi:lysostaphin resistance A-like protein [Pseudomonas sp. Pseusp122]|uniref:CPBP family intramembrane glutamic endopeptidase n=1 Tax=unclassified Pseudomonas TaxID=196821 RepID=UPI0039A5B6EB